MKAAIIIPARYASTRLPGKPLLCETGKPLIQHTYEQAMRAKHASTVIVATDDHRIVDAVTGFGGKAVMTSPEHATGSGRVAEAAMATDADIIVNLQGDEPEIDPAHIDLLVDIAAGVECFAATLVCPFDRSARSGPGSPEDLAAVKAILGGQLADGVFNAQYFTRSQCVYPRDAQGMIIAPEKFDLHVGIYAFRRSNLMQFTKWDAGMLETAENLEQLRILENGGAIAVGKIDAAPVGIDTPDDYQAFVARCKAMSP